MSEQGYTPQQVAGAVERLTKTGYAHIKGVQQRSVQPQIDRDILAWAYLHSHADLLAASEQALKCMTALGESRLAAAAFESERKAVCALRAAIAKAHGN